MPTEKDKTLDVLIVGAGFSGLYALHQLRELGFSVTVLERAPEVGGTWYWNIYPGARCDAPSIEYSLSIEEIQNEWAWSERYAAQPEILTYARFVADRLDLRRDIEFGVDVESAEFDEVNGTWLVTSTVGTEYRARFVMMATGPLSEAKPIDIDGAEDFQGATLTTSHWPREGIELAGKRVAVIGTGSSGIQAITALAPEVGELVVYQRTPAFALPARNSPISDEQMAAARLAYPGMRGRQKRSPAGGDRIDPAKQPSALELSETERTAILQDAWDKGGTEFLLRFRDLQSNLDANAVAADFLRAKVAETVQDPATATALQPTDYPVGAKRIILDTGYYEKFNLPHVHLVDLKSDPLVRITATGIETVSGHREFDAIVFATGFDALTGALNAIDIRGRGGLSLRAEWAAGPHTWLGLTVAGFPNLFTVIGPGSPSVLSTVTTSIEQHVDWICELVTAMRASGQQVVEADPEAQQLWDEHVREVAEKSLFMHAKSWYLGANVPGKPRVFLPYVGGVGRYRGICETVRDLGYAGLRFDTAIEADVAGFKEAVTSLPTAPAPVLSGDIE